MILVTGASGKTGRAAVAALARAGVETRALVRRPSQIDELTNLGAREGMAADMRLAADMRRAVENTRAVYHICPNLNPDEVEIGRGVFAAAKEAGVSHLVLHSVLHPQMQRITGDGILRNPYPVETRLSLVDLRYVAEAAALVLTERGHTGATYELTGTPAFTQTQVAELLSDALGRPVRAERSEEH